MIAVIADDFTGAAELGGVALRQGFTVKIDTEVSENYTTDVVIISTNTRSLQPEAAKNEIEKIIKHLIPLKPSLIYKKIDSLLRGNVAIELFAQMKIFKKKRALLIPANPYLNRTIRQGVYYIDDTPILESPHFSKVLPHKTSSKVVDLLGKVSNCEVNTLSPDTLLPSEGLIIGNTRNNEDLVKWSRIIDQSIVPAGGANFFENLLKRSRLGTKGKTEPFTLRKKALYVCGSTFDPSRETVRKAKEAGYEVDYMPHDLFCLEKKEEHLKAWSKRIIAKIHLKDKVIIAINELDCKPANISQEIQKAFSHLAQQILAEIIIDELVIEGGATAYAIISSLGLKGFWPQQELAQGVIRMMVEGESNLAITLKPGSYEWPESIWPFKN